MPLKGLSITVSSKKPHETQRGCLQYQTNPMLSHPPLPTCEHTVPTLELPKRNQKYKTTFTTSPKPHHNVRINDSYFPHSFYTCNTTLNNYAPPSLDYQLSKSSLMLHTIKRKPPVQFKSNRIHPQTHQIASQSKPMSIATSPPPPASIANQHQPSGDNGVD